MTTAQTDMDTYLDPIRAHLRRYTQAELKGVADDTGVSVHTLIKLRNGAINNPTLSTYHALKVHMEGRARSAA